MFRWSWPVLIDYEETSIKRIVDAALRALERTPMTIDGTDEFFGFLSAFGCRIEKQKVWFSGRVMEQTMARIAEAKAAAAADPPRPAMEVRFSVSGQALHIADTRDDSLRPATRDDLATFSRVVDAIPGLGRSHPTFVPQDAPLLTRELHAFATIILHSSRPYRVSMYSSDILKYYLEVLNVVCGDAESARKMARSLEPSKVWINSPMTITAENVRAPMEFRRLTGHPLVFTSMPVAGAATPVTPAGGLALATAEVLAGNAMSLAIDDRLAGYFAVPLFFDMKNAVTTGWGPETLLMRHAVPAIRRYLFGGAGAPPGMSAVWPAKPCAQAVMERAIGYISSFMAGDRHFGGMATLAHADVGSTVQLMLDLEIGAALRHLARGFSTDAESLAEDVIAEVAPRGAAFVDTDHTAMRFRDVSWFPDLMVRKTAMAVGDSEPDMIERARKQALTLERTAPNRCPLSEAQKREIARILAAADREAAGAA